MACKPVPFTIQVPQETLQDLRNRLRSTRRMRKYTQPEKSTLGISDFELEGLLDHWQDSFDWRAAERKLNTLPHFLVQLENLQVHFIHKTSTSESPRSETIPLLLLHGWPGSVWEMLEIIPLLAAKGFDVVCPSLPGFGWTSSPSSGQTFGALETADLFSELMTGLGYKQFGVQGGDWGGIVARILCLRHPTRCAALHLNFPCVSPVRFGAPLLQQAGLLVTILSSLFLPTYFLSKKDQQSLDRIRWYAKDSAYLLIQASRPNTLGVGLSDSPAGLLAWIAEKLQSWTDKDLDKDEILANVTLYWVTNTEASSLRFYHDTLNTGRESLDQLATYVRTPTGVANFPKEILPAPRSWARLAFNVRHWSRFDRGGHFAAWELPTVLADDVDRFFHKSIDWEACKEEALTGSQTGVHTVFEKIQTMGKFIAFCGLVSRI